MAERLAGARLLGREAALAQELLVGLGLTEAAARLGIGLSTAKTQLQGIFAKTGTRRQTDLIRLLVRGPGGMLQV